MVALETAGEAAPAAELSQDVLRTFAALLRTPVSALLGRMLQQPEVTPLPDPLLASNTHAMDTGPASLKTHTLSNTTTHTQSKALAAASMLRAACASSNSRMHEACEHEGVAAALVALAAGGSGGGGGDSGSECDD